MCRIMLNGRMDVNDKLGRIMQAVLVCFKVLPQNFPAETEENRTRNIVRTKIRNRDLTG
jgi:hypothetical protein